ncbi:MAG: hypothetical protein MJ252_01155 [archaeon]|nr:hypothetical protein [archaeon]
MAESTFTIESMIKEIKANLNKFESNLKSYEQFESEKVFKEIERIKNTLEDNFKMISPLIVKEEHRFVLNSYKELKEELNKRLKIIKKKKEKQDENKKLNDLLSSKFQMGDTENLEYLSDERRALNNCLKMSSEINNAAIKTNTELDDQEKSLNKSSQQVVKILRKIPLIEQMFGKIRFHLIKEKIILGCVIGIIAVLGIYLTFYR